MQTTSWKHAGEGVSRLGFGVMRLPMVDGKVDRDKVRPLFDRAVELGVSYFDTAWNYQNQDSEAVLGEMLRRYPREKYFVADKLPCFLGGDWEARKDLDATFEEQLRRTGLEHFDFYLAHGLGWKLWLRMQKLGMPEMFHELKRQGRIRETGFSYHGPVDEFKQVVDAFDWDFVQIQINYVDTTLQNAGEMYNYLTEKGIPCVVMEPIRGGALARLPDNAQAVLDAYEGEKQSPAAWSFRWCLSHPNMRVMLSGMNSLEQIEENARVFSESKPLTDAEMKMMDRVRDKILETRTVPCTGCNYCDSCPTGVAIPEIFDIYNQWKLFGNVFHSMRNYRSLKETRDASACTACGHCVELCPQKIEIPQQFGPIHEELMALTL